MTILLFNMCSEDINPNKHGNTNIHTHIQTRTVDTQRNPAGSVGRRSHSPTPQLFMLHSRESGLILTVTQAVLHVCSTRVCVCVCVCVYACSKRVCVFTHRHTHTVKGLAQSEGVYGDMIAHES